MVETTLKIAYVLVLIFLFSPIIWLIIKLWPAIKDAWNEDDYES